jgi:acetyl-CoA carboxylase biotin carboxyl carrier protein
MATEKAGKGKESRQRPARAEVAGGERGGGSSDWADLDFVRGLIEVVDASGIDSVEVTRAGTRVKISKSPPGGGGFANPPAYPAGFGHFMPGMGGMPGMAVPPGGAGGNAAVPAAAPEGGAGAGGGAAPAGAGGGSGAGAAVAGDVGGETGLVDVKSPMVGTFYRAPAPEAPPYVEVGSRITKGQTLCILEAMKLMNELESEVEGVMRQVLVENADPVEYGQVLFRIDPNG